MAEQVTSPPTQPADPVPEFVSAEEYMAKYAEDFYEWEDGRLVKMAPIHFRHDQLTGYTRLLFNAYFALRPIGRVIGEPFVMRLAATRSYREPDLQIILNNNPGQFTDTAMIGPADICIEVVSPESGDRDYGKKFLEYEKAGVPEYWIFDPIREVARFNRLNANGVYADIAPDAEGYYQTPLLPGFRLHVPTLWQEVLPDFFEIGQLVRDMLGE
jgi:Uma2 family endonuclease